MLQKVKLIGMIVSGLVVSSLYLWKQNAIVDWGGLPAVMVGQAIFVLALLTAFAGIFGLSRKN